MNKKRLLISNLKHGNCVEIMRIAPAGLYIYVPGSGLKRYFNENHSNTYRIIHIPFIIWSTDSSRN